MTPDFEIILVNDGSLDDSLRIAVELYERDPRVKVIDLSRNFGHHKAMMTGLAHAQGRLVFLIDCDLEVAPETLTTFHEKLCSTRSDVVYGVQQERHDYLMDRLAARIFYVIFNLLSSDPLPINLVTTRLMSQRYVSALVAHQEREVLIGGLWVVTGFQQVPITVTKTYKGNSSYHLGRRITVLVNAVTSFSNKPLVLIFYLGIAISLLAGLAGLDLIIRRLVFGTLLEGWPSLIISVWFLGGLTIFCLGIIGIYLSKIFMETKQRPYTIVRHIYERK
jgi:putative glycosyltransferase